jgi:hypothetical protein
MGSEFAKEEQHKRRFHSPHADSKPASNSPYDKNSLVKNKTFKREAQGVERSTKREYEPMIKGLAEGSPNRDDTDENITKLEAVKTAVGFCTRFLSSNICPKLNANMNQLSYLLNESGNAGQTTRGAS